MPRGNVFGRERVLAHLDVDLRGEPPADVDDPVAAVVASLDLDQLRYRKVEQLIPAVTRLGGGGPSPDEIPSLVRWRVVSNVELSWDSIGQLRIGEILEWPGTGPRKAKAFLEFLLRRVVFEIDELPVAAPGVVSTSELFDALRRVAAWGWAKGLDSLLDALDLARRGSADAPVEALEVLDAVDLPAFAGEALLSEADPDPVAAAERLLGRFGERDRDLLARRALVPTRSDRETLQQIADRYGVTRERIRQLESRVLEELHGLVGRDEFQGVRKRVEEIRLQVGTASPLSELPPELQQDDRSLVDELLAFLAGPYRYEDGWAVLDRVGSVEQLVEGAFEEVAEDGVADLDALVDALVDRGVVEARATDAMRACGRIRVVGDHVLKWTGGQADRAVRLLRARGVPGSSEELASLAEATSLPSFRNALGTDERIRRIGKDRYALAEWGHDEYAGIVPEMLREIERHPGRVEIRLLAADLADRFGISPHSVDILSATHPAFVREEGFVRRRGDDEPYQPKLSLEETAHCYVVDGAWSYRLTVDRDVLRGSGRTIPEAFAVHLGVHPGQSGRLTAPRRPVAVGWGQSPYIGSIRAEAQALDARLGDLLFIRRRTASSLDFVLVRSEDLTGADPAAAVALMVGAQEPVGSPWQRVLADALGIGGAVQPPVQVLRARLEQRGERNLLDLIGSLDGS